MGTIYDELKDITNWLKYTPLDGHFYTYKNNVTFAAHKITDLYYQICNARMSLHFGVDFDKYSMMSESDMAILSSKKYFIENALLYYNFSVDYLWQVLWLYYDNSDEINEIPSNELYERIMKECDLDSLIRGLTEIHENKIVDVLKKEFSSKNSIYSEGRYYYNYLKHRAVFHTPSLGMNDSVGMYPIPALWRRDKENGELLSYKIPLISRVELDIDKLKDLLMKFDRWFVELCEYFIQLIIPKDYALASNIKILTMENYTKNHLDELEQYSKKHPEIVSKMKCDFE